MFKLWENIYPQKEDNKEYRCDCGRQFRKITGHENKVYREKGLKELQKMLQFQKYIPKIELRYFLSNNPIALIQKMIEESPKQSEDIPEWINQMKSGEKKRNLSDFYTQYQQKLPEVDKIFGNIIEKNAVRYEKRQKDL